MLSTLSSRTLHVLSMCFPCSLCVFSMFPMHSPFNVSSIPCAFCVLFMHSAGALHVFSIFHWLPMCHACAFRSPRIHVFSMFSSCSLHVSYVVVDQWKASHIVQCCYSFGSCVPHCGRMGCNCQSRPRPLLVQAVGLCVLCIVISSF